MLRSLAIAAVAVIIGTTILNAALQPAPATTTGVAATATPTPTPTASPAPAGQDRRLTAVLSAVEQAFNIGDVVLLCRPGGLVDPAVITQQAQNGGCERQLETLRSAGPMRLTVQAVSAHPDLATATVRTADGTVVPVDLVRTGSRWLLSFSNGSDPISALTR